MNRFLKISSHEVTQLQGLTSRVPSGLDRFLKLGYKPDEARWITNLLNNKFDLDGHSHYTGMYTNIIVSNINRVKDWDKTHVHLNFDEIFKYFYFPGCKHLGNSLLSHSFREPHEIECLKNFDNKKIITKDDLLPLLKKVKLPMIQAKY